jgi:hypothetical protein
MKLCTDCKWMTNPGYYAMCDAPKNIMGAPGLSGVPETGMDPRVPDGIVRRWIYCTTQRGMSRFAAYASRSCGPQGRWWEPIP